MAHETFTKEEQEEISKKVWDRGIIEGKLSAERFKKMDEEMRKSNLSCDKIAYYLQDEIKASDEYEKLGLHEMSKEEFSHFEHFSNKLIENNCKNEIDLKDISRETKLKVHDHLLARKGIIFPYRTAEGYLTEPTKKQLKEIDKEYKEGLYEEDED